MILQEHPKGVRDGNIVIRWMNQIYIQLFAIIMGKS